ncbi:MAG: Putative iron-sulfur cluster assembly scaffold protein for SUF system, SufE2 [uncultured Rubrobacteraceae bacterium]|uniref:Iron-sulfur cluster assembly scaffold protein for SUF system, SufE2 n=1 Tax=uncultured Rubrobacteraceae bacterium TaxID=349277 RepID=A0A6J4QV24_9ACTN|nr:MAG: Putative iron-sulfur cluster assembly scaffold protein for SUF system, SufE2 [uncultured Rubrobacteraceae bacterium]
MDRQLQIQILLDHYQNPRHSGALEEADVEMPGGNPGCGDVVTVYLKGAGDHEHIEGVSYEGEGCTISMAASSMLLEQVVAGNMTMDEVLELDYNEMMDQLGRQIVASRPKCATLGLGTLKAAIRKYQRDKRLDAAGVPRSQGPVPEEGLVFGEGATEAAKKD